MTCIAGAVIRKPLFKSFIHMLRDVNPGTAAALERDSAKHHDDKDTGRKSSRTMQKVRHALPERKHCVKMTVLAISMSHFRGSHV